MKAIRIHGQVLDNGGAYQDAGAELTVSDEPKKGCIGAKRAEQLVKINSASAVSDKPEKKASKAD